MRRWVAASLAVWLAALPVTAFAVSTVVERGQTQCRQVALTFDAGSTAVSAQGIMDALAAHRIRSTFFLPWRPGGPRAVALGAAVGWDDASRTVLID